MSDKSKYTRHVSKTAQHTVWVDYAATKYEILQQQVMASLANDFCPAMPPRPPKQQPAAVRVWEQVHVWRDNNSIWYLDGPQDLECPRAIARVPEDPFWDALFEVGYAGQGTPHAELLARFAVLVLEAPWPTAEFVIATDASAIEIYSAVFHV